MQSTVTLELYEYNEIFMNSTLCEQYKQENKILKEENKLLKAQKVNLPDEVEFYDTPYGKVVVINGKQIKLKNGNIQLCNKKDDTLTYTVKGDSTQVYKVMKNAVDKYNRELAEKEVSNGVVLYDKDNPEKKVVIDNKGIRLYKGDILTSIFK